MTTTIEPTTKSSLHEVWSKNERMRHVPGIDWIIWKIDVELRHRIETLFAPFGTLAFDHPRHAEIENEVKALCRAIDRLSDIARHTRNGHAPNELGHRIGWAINHAVTSLTSLDPASFGRRYPFHTFERSKGEPVYAGLLAVICHVERLTAAIRTIEPNIDEKLWADLIQPQHPLSEQVLRPIA